MSFAPGASNGLWLHAVVSGIMIVIHAAVQWTQAPSVLASTMVLVGLLFCRMVLQSAVLVGHLPAMPSGKAVCLALALLLSFLAVISLGVMALNAPLHVSPSILAHNFGSGIGALYAGLGLAAIRTGLRIILVHCMVAGQLREDTGPAAWYRVRKILMLFASIATSVPIIVAALMQPTHSDTYVILATTWACDVLERAVFIGAYSSPLSATVRTALHLMRARANEELSDGTFSANSADADIDRLKAMYRSDSVDACLGMVSSMYFAQAWLSVIPALLVLWVLERSGRVPWLPNEPWVDLVTRAVAVFVFGIVLEIPGLTIVFSVMRLASRIPNGTTFNPPPEAIVAGPSDITLVVAYGLIAMSASVAWAVGGW